MSGENHPMFSLSYSPETKAKIQAAISGSNNPMFGKTHTPETKALMSEAKKGKNNPLFGKKGKNHPLHGLTNSDEAIAKISATKGVGTIYVYSSDRLTLLNTFLSARKAGEHFKVDHKTISKYVKSGKPFKDEWILSLTLISS